jgi:hemerythrin
MLVWNDSRHALGMAEMDATQRDFVACLHRCLAADDAAFPVLYAALGELPARR